MLTGYFNAILSSDGIPLPATITVYYAGTLDLATIYADNLGAAQKDNPFQTDSLGRFQFFGAAMLYDILASGQGITGYTIEDVSLSYFREAAWTAASFLTGWSNVGSPYQACQYKKIGDRVYLRGMATCTSWATNPNILLLDPGYRPPAILLFIQYADSNSWCRVNIESDGAVKWIVGGAGSGAIDLGGIIFSVE